MAWLTSLPTGEVMSEAFYYEGGYKGVPVDHALQWQVMRRKRSRKVTEYRGLDYATAKDNSDSIFSGETTTSFELQSIGAGGYTLIKTEDGPVGDWE